MDIKVSTAQNIFVEIVHEVYPLIETKFNELYRAADWQENAKLYDSVQELEREFNSLAYYEKKLVFPALMDKINDEQKTPVNQNPEEILRLVSLKEQRIYLLADYTKNLSETTDINEKHPIFELINLFDGAFKNVKDKWQVFLKKLSTQKTCPAHLKST